MQYKEKEIALLISLLRTALGGPAPTLPDDVDWEHLYALAVAHKVAAMACAALSDTQGVPQPVMDRFVHTYRKEISAQILRRNEGVKILNAFEVNGIDCVPLKGWIMQDLYPNPAMRYMCDLDSLFKPEQSADVQRVLEALDYVPQELGGNPEVYFKKPIMNIEMHKRIMRDDTDHFDRTWERVVPQENCSHTFSMTDEDYYIYMIAHFFKHFHGGGTGVRYICDTEVFLRAHGDTLDREYVDGQLERSGYLDFERKARALCGVWFRGDASDSVLNAFAQKIVCSAVFGTGERQADNYVHNAVEQMHGKTVQAKKRRYLLSLLFPALAVMQDVYPVLRKVPFLLPVFWIIRAVQRLFTGRDRAKEMISRADKIAQQIEREEGGEE